MAKYSYPVDFESTFWTIIDGDYYVSTIGNDITGDGSPKKPFLTIAKAFEFALDGEKVVIGPDEYIDTDATGSGPGGAEIPCRLATTGNISLSIGGMFTIDGTLTGVGDRVLVWNQTDPSENGIYIASTGPWQRADDFKDAKNIINGKLIPILEGALYSKSIFQHTTIGTITLGSTALTFEKSVVTDWGDIQGDINAQADLTGKISNEITVAIDNLKGGVPVEGDTLNKLYNLTSSSLKGTDIDSLTKLQNLIGTKLLQFGLNGSNNFDFDEYCDINIGGNSFRIGSDYGKLDFFTGEITLDNQHYEMVIPMDGNFRFSLKNSGDGQVIVFGLDRISKTIAFEYISNGNILHRLVMDANGLRLDTPYNGTDSNDIVPRGWIEQQIAQSSGSAVQVLKVMFESDLDNIQDVRFSGPITVQAPELYHGITTVTYEVALDGASPTFTAQADTTALQNWINANITGSTKWILRLITNASKQSQVDFKYSQV